MSYRTCFRVSNITLLTSDNSVKPEIPKLVRNDNIVRIRFIQRNTILFAHLGILNRMNQRQTSLLNSILSNMKLTTDYLISFFHINTQDFVNIHFLSFTANLYLTDFDYICNISNTCIS